ncbi:excalibur calcium-binding domain-containing protein [Novosphingobium gossypii]
MWRSCAQARAAGAAPIHRGEPKYNPVLDGDGDGIACEPYRQRR